MNRGRDCAVPLWWGFYREQQERLRIGVLQEQRRQLRGLSSGTCSESVRSSLGDVVMGTPRNDVDDATEWGAFGILDRIGNPKFENDYDLVYRTSFGQRRVPLVH